MTIDGAVLGRLKAVTAITDIVGAGANARISQLHLPQTPTLEAITFHQISAVRMHAFGSDPGLVTSRFQVDSWGNTPEESRVLGEAVRVGLSRFNGTVDSTLIHDVFLANEISFFEDETREYRVFQDYMIWFGE